MRDMVLDEGQRPTRRWSPITLPGGPQAAEQAAAPPPRQRMVIVRDMLVVLAGALVGILGQLPWRGPLGWDVAARFAVLLLVTTVAFGGLLALASLYEPRPPRSAMLTYMLLTASPTILAALAASSPFIGFTPAQRDVFMLAAAVGLAAASVSHLTWNLAAKRAAAQHPRAERIILVGPAAQARLLEERLAAAAPHCRVVASVGAADGPRALGLLSQALAALASGSQPTAVLLTTPQLSAPQLREAVTLCAAYGLRCLVLPEAAEAAEDCALDLTRLGSLVFLSALPDSRRTWYPVVKRALDAVGAALFLCVLAPLLAAVALLIKLDSPGPVLYRQERVGRGNRPFAMLKFRSMCEDAEHQVHAPSALNEADGPLFKIRSDPRVTRMGRLLRRLSIDELPQLLNVLVGDMSPVGPRPPLRREVDQYEPWQYGRLAATPGVTGLWQVSGRSDLSFQEGVALDLHYIRHCSLGLDATILLRTIPAVLRCRGAY